MYLSYVITKDYTAELKQVANKESARGHAQVTVMSTGQHAVIAVLQVGFVSRLIVYLVVHFC